MTRCAICDRKITTTFYICEECEAKYGKRVKDRPTWANFMVNDTRTNYYHSRQQIDNEVQFTDLSDDYKNQLGVEDLFDN